MQPGSVLTFEIAAQIAGALSGRRVRQIAAGMLLSHVRPPTSARTPSLCLTLPLSDFHAHSLTHTPLACSACVYVCRWGTLAGSDRRRASVRLEVENVASLVLGCSAAGNSSLLRCAWHADMNTRTQFLRSSPPHSLPPSNFLFPPLTSSLSLSIQRSSLLSLLSRWWARALHAQAKIPRQ